MPNEDQLNVEVHKVEKTGRSDGNVDVLEVSLMIQVADRMQKEFKGWVYSDKVDLKSDPDYANLHPEDLKDLMAGIAHEWTQQFGDRDLSILSRENPVTGCE